MTEEVPPPQEEREENEFLKLKKQSRCEIFAQSSTIPNSYKENTLKEELILEHVIQFKKEFGLTYDPKREILLYPQNECGKYKFICTTVRPTKVPYPELYDYKKCAKFISEFFEYEELNPPTEFPKFIPAPDNVVKWQIGDSFDISIVTASLLIGAGYNAYVIYGKAPRFITSKDETRLSPPEMPDDIRIIEPDLEEKQDDVEPTIKDKVPIFSQFDLDEKKERELKEKEEFIKNTVIDDDMPEFERNDPFKHRRIHCWVLLKLTSRNEDKSLKREMIFIEPSTGRLYDVKNSPYEQVDAMFNNYNFYINLHMDKPVNEIDWNTNKATNWEYVMLNSKEGEEVGEIEEENVAEENEGEEEKKEDENFNNVNLNNNENNNHEEKNKEVLDMPPPWPNRIIIPLQKYNERSPTQTQVYFYEKTKVEKFAPFSQTDGLIMKIYNFKDYARFLLMSVEHRYRNRGDKLYKKIYYPYEHKTIDYYLPGQIWHWKEVEEVEASYKKINFYPTNFETGIIYREEIFGQKILHKYESRDDKVFERKILLDKDSKQTTKSYRFSIDSPLYDKKILITKFTQKTNFNPLLNPESQIFKLSYKFDDKGTQIQVINHYGKGKILSKPDIFSFEDESLSNGDKDDSKKIDDDREIWKRNTFAKKAQYIEDFKKIEDAYNKNYIESIQFLKRISDNRRLATDNNKKLYEKGPNDLIPILEKSIFDLDNMLDEDERDKDKNDYTGNQQSFDRINHFLQIQKEKMEKGEEPEKIKEDIIKAFKDEKTTVTNVLQQLLKEQVTNLQNKIESFKNKETYSKEEIDKHNLEVNEIQRKINIIYQRSHKHITKIMEELNELLEKMDENFAKE